MKNNKFDTSYENYLNKFNKYESTIGDDTFKEDKITYFNKSKNDISLLIEHIESYLVNKNLNENEWQKVISLRNNAKVKLNDCNDRLNEILKSDFVTTDKMKLLQMQRYRRIFDQLTNEFKICNKKLDTQYQTYMLFNTNKTQYNKSNIINSGKAIMEAIIDVESLTEQASINLNVLKKGNKQMNKVYNRLNLMVDEHLFNITKLQKNQFHLHSK